MTFSESDKQALKAPDVLHAYCRATLGEGKRVGGKMFYPCPYGAHTRLKLEVTDKNGCGLALCRACNAGGDVFSVAAGVLGLDVRKDFEQVAQAVADAVGYVLADSGEKPRRKRKKPLPPLHGGRVAQAINPPAEKATESALEYLPADEEARALEAVARLRENPAMQARWAQELRLPPWAIQMHTLQESAPLGLLGLDERGRLQYVYTHTPADGERVRVHLVKTRCKEIPWKIGDERPFHIPPGSSKARPWGWDTMAGANVIIMTEGEADALAVRASFDAWQEQERTLNPDAYPAPDELPAIVARPDAGTFPAAWAEKCRGKRVILLADNDGGAGEKGAKSITDKLKNAGVRRVHIWKPTDGAKDARDVFDMARPWALFEAIILDNKEQ